MNSKALFFLGLIALACVLPTNASGSDDDRVDGSHEDSDGERETNFERGGNEVKVESEGKTGNQKDKFELRAKFEGAQMELEMRQFTRVADTASGFRFRIRPHSVVEYVETDGQAGLTAGDNTNCTSVLLRGDTFSASNWRVSTVGNDTFSQIDLTTNTGLFKLTLTVSGAPAVRARRSAFSGRTLTPTTAKFDITLDPATANFPWRCANSRLALLVKVKSRQSKRAKTDTGATVQTAVQLGSDASPLGFFSWATSVTVNNNVTGVAVVPSGFVDDSGPNAETDLDSGEGESAQRCYYSFIYNRPNKVYWDPEIGYSPAGSSSAAAPTSTASVLVMSVLALAAAFAAKF